MNWVSNIGILLVKISEYWKIIFEDLRKWPTEDEIGEFKG